MLIFRIFIAGPLYGLFWRNDKNNFFVKFSAGHFFVVTVSLKKNKKILSEIFAKNSETRVNCGEILQPSGCKVFIQV